jgi:hypothetical protein
VNAVGTELEYDHDVVERDGDGGLTVRYLAGPKRGLLIHFFAESELDALFAVYDLVLAPGSPRPGACLTSGAVVAVGGDLPQPA